MRLHSEMDSDRFGFAVGKAFAVTAATLSSVLAASRRESLRLLLARCPAHDWDTVHALEANGFLLMDTLVYLRRSLVEPLPKAPGNMRIRSAKAEDVSQIEEIARDAFADYESHYRTDLRLDRCKVAEIYPSWARRATLDRTVAEVTLVAEVEGRVAGFGAMKAVGNGALDAVLYAVSPTFRRRGVFHELLCASLAWGATSGFSVIDYSTQITNVAAQKSVVRLGFVPDRGFYTFHRWFDS